MQTTGASHTTHANVLGRSSQGYTFEVCVTRAVRVKRCSRSRSSSEVVVHVATVVEVVVHGDGSCTRDLGDGSGTSCSGTW